MSPDEALEMLRSGPSGVEAWNRFRSAEPNLSEFDLPNLSRKDLAELELNGVDLSGMDLSSVHFGSSSLVRANLSNSQLTGSLFPAAILVEADLSHSDLAHVKFDNTNLVRAKLVGCNLYSTRFLRSFLTEADFSETRCLWTSFFDVDLASARGIETITHFAPSSLSVNTLFMYEKLPEIFLRGCGIPETLITYLPSLTGAAIDFYSCFISYTEADDEFSKRLFNDLQGEGIRCWRWREDAKTGSALRDEILEGIRVHDKVVVILSEAALGSQAVIDEIELALKKEKKEKCDVLFPIRLDDAVFRWAHPLKKFVVDKVIGDFSEWSDPDRYRRALERHIAYLRTKSKPH